MTTWFLDPAVRNPGECPTYPVNWAGGADHFRSVAWRHGDPATNPHGSRGGVRSWLFIAVALAVGVFTIDGSEPVDSVDPDHDGTSGRCSDSSDQSQLFKRNDHRERKCRRSADPCLCAGWLGDRDDGRECNVRRYMASSAADLGWSGLGGGIEQSLWRPLQCDPQGDPKGVCLRDCAICSRPRCLQPDALYAGPGSAPGLGSDRRGIGGPGGHSGTTPCPRDRLFTLRGRLFGEVTPEPKETLPRRAFP